MNRRIVIACILIATTGTAAIAESSVQRFSRLSAGLTKMVDAKKALSDLGAAVLADAKPQPALPAPADMAEASIRQKTETGRMGQAANRRRAWDTMRIDAGRTIEDLYPGASTALLVNQVYDPKFKVTGEDAITNPADRESFRTFHARYDATVKTLDEFIAKAQAELATLQK